MTDARRRGIIGSATAWQDTDMAGNKGKSKFTPAAAEMARSWESDRSSFPGPLLACLDSGDDASVTQFLKSLPSGSRGLAEETVVNAADSMLLDGNVLARLFAIPVLVHPDDGDAPDAGELSSALSRPRIGLLAKGPYAVVLPFYLDPVAVGDLPLSGRRTLVRSIARGTPVDPALAGFSVPTPTPGERGSPAAVLGVVVHGLPGGETFLDMDPDPENLAAFKEAALASGGGIVDVEDPGTVACLVGAYEEEGNWIVASSGTREEILGFVSAAELEAAEDGVACHAERSPGKLTASLLDEAGNMLDRRTFPVDGMSISRGEVSRLLAAACRSYTVRDVVPARPPFLAAAPGTVGAATPGFRKPALRVVGGKGPDRPGFVIPESVAR